MIIPFRRSTVMLAIMLAAPIAGCDWGADKPAENRSNSTAGSDSGRVDPDGVQRYVFHGTPTAIDTARGIITVAHEKIGDFMEAMTMPFPVADRAILAQVAVGRETHFTLEVERGSMKITKVEDGHAPGHEH